MTQENILVSPLTSACPKPGGSTPAFRPAEPGDTRRDVAHPALRDNLQVSGLSSAWTTAHRDTTTVATANPVNPINPVKNPRLAALRSLCNPFFVFVRNSLQRPFLTT
jgi:hypothetical protein